MRRVLQVDGRLHLSDGERDITVTGAGPRVEVEIGDLPTRRIPLRRLGARMRAVRRLSRELEKFALTVVVTRCGAPFIELGAGVRGGLLARIFGLPHLRFSKRR